MSTKEFYFLPYLKWIVVILAFLLAFCLPAWNIPRDNRRLERDRLKDADEREVDDEVRIQNGEVRNRQMTIEMHNASASETASFTASFHQHLRDGPVLVSGYPSGYSKQEGKLQAEMQG
ncbi:hypothetical protein L6452_41834 [Arctium lappa]|uniref:Uncharacterized protein n=1 Tax=Arctium lappa TaxID=4217 RepID=A0ACB8XHQ8_ARCLA|nr:hypothetical protein L6452_41834 [Arctium lappa]